jgi:predicted chitinase
MLITADAIRPVPADDPARAGAPAADMPRLLDLLHGSDPVAGGQALARLDAMTGSRALTDLLVLTQAAAPETVPAGAVAAGAPLPPMTADQLRAIMPNAGTRADTFVGPLNEAMAANGITTEPQRAAFLAQIAVESGDLRHTEENLNYSAQRLTEVWPRRFPTLAAAAPYANSPEALANRVYADRLGNGDAASGDGWLFRGRGLMQVTGRDNYRAVGYEDNPAALADPATAASTAAAWYLGAGLPGRTTDVLDRAAFDGVSRTVNGGDHGSQARWDAYQRALDTFGVAR